MTKVWTYIIASALVAFSLLTLFLSGSVIFDFFNIRAKEGNYVLFIVWANFISSFVSFFCLRDLQIQKMVFLFAVNFADYADSRIFWIINIYLLWRYLRNQDNWCNDF